jgi:hypothetical protein
MTRCDALALNDTIRSAIVGAKRMVVISGLIPSCSTYYSLRLSNASDGSGSHCNRALSNLTRLAQLRKWRTPYHHPNAMASSDSTRVILLSSTRPDIYFAPREIKQLFLLSLAFSLVWLYPILCDSSLTGPGIGVWLLKPRLAHFSLVPSDGADRDLFVQLRWVAYYTIAHFHQWPFWNPYKCGGMTLIGNPESAVVTPFLLFYLILGLIPGILFEVYFHLAIMFSGGYVLGRELELAPLAALVLAVVFPSSSWLSLHIALGHLNFLSIAYVPWILALLLMSCRLRRWHLAMLGGLLCGLALTEGNYGFAFAVMLVALVAMWCAMIQLSIRPLLAGALIGIFAVLFSLPKLIPTAEQLMTYPRETLISYLRWHGVITALFSRDQDITRPTVGSFFFAEYAGYIGAPFVMLALVGAISDIRKSAPWVVGAIFFLTLYRGDTTPDSLTMWLRHLPLAGNIGLCGRWAIPLVFCVGVLAALGATLLCERPQVWGRRLVTILFTVGVVDAWLVCAPNYRYFFQPALPRPEPSQTFRQYWSGLPVPLTSIAMAGMGSVNCGDIGYHIRPPKDTVLGWNQKGYRGEYYLLDAGDVTETLWTPNRMSYEVKVPSPTSLVINQIMYRGWHLTYGDGLVYPEHRLIAVRIPAGRQEIELQYTPHHIYAAFAIMLAALAILILTWWLELRSS